MGEGAFARAEVKSLHAHYRLTSRAEEIAEFKGMKRTVRSTPEI